MLRDVEQNSYANMIRPLVDDFYSKEVDFKHKSDGSLITQVDIGISQNIENFLKEKLPKVNFLSEEKKGSLKENTFILDPIDGTSGFVKKNNEWVVSLAYFKTYSISDTENEAIIYNPYRPLWAMSWNQELKGRLRRDNILGSVSRNDFNEKELEHVKRDDVSFVQLGSIALKLAMLSLGEYDFVYSKTSKNIWDIAAGTVLCYKVGIYLFNRYGRVRELSNVKQKGPLLWCAEEDFNRLSYLLERE